MLLCVTQVRACVQAGMCNYGWEGKRDKEIRESSWTLVSLAVSTHGTLLNCLDSQCPLAVCPHSNSWKGLRQKNNHLEESPSGLALVPEELLTAARDVHFHAKLQCLFARHFKSMFPKTAFFYLFHLINLKLRTGYWVLASDAELLYLSGVHCSKGKTSNASVPTHSDMLCPTTQDRVLGCREVGARTTNHSSAWLCKQWDLHCLEKSGTFSVPWCS